MRIPFIAVRVGFQRHGRPPGTPDFVPESYSYSAPGGLRFGGAPDDSTGNPPPAQMQMTQQLGSVKERQQT